MNATINADCDEVNYITMLVTMRTAIEMKKLNAFDASEVIARHTKKSLEMIVDDLLKEQVRS